MEDNTNNALLQAGTTALIGTNPVVGGIVAGLTGVLGAAAARKQRKREAKAGYQQNLMTIESNKTQMQQALNTSLANSLAATLRR